MSTRFAIFGMIAGGVVAFTMQSTVAASLTQTNVPSSPGPGYTISATDLIDSSQPATFSGVNLDSGSFNACCGTQASRLAALNDGATSFSALADPQVSDTVTYTLNTSVNTLGYNLTEIDTTTLSGGDDRNSQINEVLYHKVGDPATMFTSLGIHSYAPTVTNDNKNPIDGQIQLTDTTGTVASGVDQVRFVLMANGGSQNTGYSELDVFGAATTPEPASLGLLGLGGLGLLARGRRA